MWGHATAGAYRMVFYQIVRVDQRIIRLIAARRMLCTLIMAPLQHHAPKLAEFMYRDYLPPGRASITVWVSFI